jgi:chemotaxis protein histidine kinase CheA
MALDPSKYLAQFVEESLEHCGRITDGLLGLEQAGDHTEAVHALFRAAHTIKGSARMLKLMGVSELAHHMEDLLDALRTARIPFSPELADLLFQAVDALVEMLVGAGAGDQPEAPAALVRELAQAAAGPEAPPAPPAEQAVAPAAGEPQETPKEKAEFLRIRATKLDDLLRLMGELVSAHRRVRGEVLRLRQAERLGHSARAVTEAVAQEDSLVTELQDIALRLVMLPLASVFDPLRRTVRDLAREHGKDIDFLVEGGETELDRKVIERVGDPILHMIRNALDHGLEGPEERLAAGKPARGTLELSARYAGGCVTIALRDDGRGLAPDKIRDKALARRLFDPETLARLSRAELLNLIFLPGFSTSPIITDLSGRGVGMDVVRKNVVDELKGAVTIETEEGRGTTFFLHLPLNLAVFPLYLVSVAGKTCALPATAILEMLAIAPGGIVQSDGQSAIRLREELIPVAELAPLLGLPETGGAMAVIVRNGEEKLGLLVDDILAREEWVVKPVPPLLKPLKLLTGVTIGEGDRIISVLNVPELMRRARRPAEPARVTGAARGARILVVDDSGNIRAMEREFLESAGYAVDTAEDGLEGLERALGGSYDLVITDVEMPRMDGFALTGRLRADERCGRLPIIIVTSLARDEDRQRGIQAGADAYLVKGGFDQSSLLDIVRTLIG